MRAAIVSLLNARHLKPLREGQALLLLGGMILTLVAALLLVFPTTLLRQADQRIYDWMQEARRTPPRSGLAVMVGIDEESLANYGQWPWPRYRLARLVEALHDHGATVVALDFLLAEPDRTSPEVLEFERQRDGVDPSPFAGSSSQDSNSLRLAQALARGKTVIGYHLGYTGRSACTANQDLPVPPEGTVLIRTPGSTTGWPVPAEVTRSLPLLTAAASSEGFTNAGHDPDGTLRRAPLVLEQDGRIHPSLAMSALLLTTPERTLRLEKTSSATSLWWKKTAIPLDDSGMLLVDFRSRQDSFAYFSARDVLDGGLAPGSLQGKIVLVGAWATGLGDRHLTPSGRILNGLEIHATIIDNLASGTFINRPGWARGAEFAGVLLFGLLVTLMLSRPGYALAMLAVAGGTAGSMLGARALLVHQDLYLSPLMPALATLVTALVLSLLKYGIEARKVWQRTRDLIEAQDTIITGMSTLAEARDKETGGHILRTQRYVEILAKQLQSLPRYRSLDDNTIELLAKSAPLHDIGKVGIPDHILHKPGRLDEDEFAVMQTHTTIGAAAIGKVIGRGDHPENNEFLDIARQMIISHHERWDGQGYPAGLRGEEIPLAGRLMALADVYDALVSRRVYKEGLSHAEVREMIERSAGSQFDPEIVQAFVERNEEFLHVSRQFSDDENRQMPATAGTPPASSATS